MNYKIRKASQADTSGLATSLARAFDDDPILNWLVRKDNKRKQGMKRMFHACISDLCLPHDSVLVADDLSGGALWYPPETYKLSLIKQLLLGPKMIPVVGFNGLLRLALAMDISGRQHPKESHYYLEFIGVIPECRGTGAGAALITPILDICDRDKCGAFLISSKEINIPFYRRFGFAVQEKIFLGKDSPPIWPMWRNPQV